jgi:DNA-directed RNA polymerase specialized sigma24 family protein
MRLLVVEVEPRMAAALPVELREPLILRELEELSHKQIADITHTPIATRREL